MNSQEIEDGFIKGVYESRDLRLADCKWLEIWPALREDYSLETGMKLEISCTYRSPQAQNDLYQIGRSKPPIGKEHRITNCDGQTTLSKHNLFPSLAIDVFAMFAGKPMAIWGIEAYAPLKDLAKRYKLIWGGDWPDFKDRPHLELDA